MVDSFSETTTTGWIGRIGESIKGILFGALLFIVAFPVLFWNEGRAVKRAIDLDEGMGAVVSADPASVNPSNDGKLVHMTGQAHTDETLQDQAFGISAENGIRLQRIVEMYQWEESSKTETKKKLGGGEERVTTYDYQQVWSDSHIDSNSFHQKGRQAHANPPAMPVKAQEFNAENVTVGQHRLSPQLINQINNFEAIQPDNNALAAAGEADIALPAKLNGDYLYFGNTPQTPSIGDVRIKFQAALPTTVSFIAQQQNGSFADWSTTSGRSLEQRLEIGTLSADQMFEVMKQENTFLTWALRGVGLFLMFFGLMLVLKPISVIADVIPFIGNIVGFGSAIVALLVSVSLSFITISVAWIFYRPLIGVPLLVIGIGVAVALFLRNKSGQPKPATS